MIESGTYFVGVVLEESADFAFFAFLRAFLRAFFVVDAVDELSDGLADVSLLPEVLPVVLPVCALAPNATKANAARMAAMVRIINELPMKCAGGKVPQLTDLGASDMPKKPGRKSP